MDNDLERSVRLLEDALQTPTKGLFKVSTATPKREKPNLSFTINPEDLTGLEYGSVYQNTLSLFVDDDKTVTGSVIQAGTPWKNTVNNLYTEFADILQGSTGGLDILDVAEDLARCCSDALAVVKSLKAKVATSELAEEKWLENERNNWRLLYVLYQDRIQAQNHSKEGFEEDFGSSEKNCVCELFKRENLVRESQLVIDWLERNALEKGDPILMHSDWTYGWEHTLHQLLAPDAIAIGSNVDIIKNIHPDAPQFQRLSLHHLDYDNDKKLCQRIFMEIRCGNLEGAQELCYNSGYPWRAAMLEGWKLFHNPNLETSLEEYKDVEGNQRRDLWKSCALDYCHRSNLNIYEKAAIGSLCGFLEGILPVCTTWEDHLWAYMRTMVDIRVESEIRDSIIKNYIPLPEEYWEQKKSLSEIFTILEASKNIDIAKEAHEIDHVIQKLVILDEIPTLIRLLDQWSEDLSVTTQSLRFYAHLVLFFESVGDSTHRKTCEKIVETYIERLSEMNETQLVAFYVSKLGKSKQIQLYAKHCEKLLSTEQRKNALTYAEDFSLDVFAITQQIVEIITSRPSESELPGNLQGKITEIDELKISAIDWLMFYEEQRAEALAQTNSIIFKFLILGKLEAAQLAINKIPYDSIEKIRSEEQIHQIVKNYLSYKAYLDAHEAFNEWFRQYRNKPMPPPELPENAQFTEKVAHNHKVSQFNAEAERWKLTTSHSAKRAKTLLYNVLLFPEGWLEGGDDAEYLRSICIPQIVLLLYSVLNESGLHEEAVQLADLVAAKKYGLYKVYSKEKLAEILEKICESSVALLNAKKDPFGSSSSV
ncbi:nuclear pore complex protein Nup107 [Tribolium castaneum]|uniref:Nuclear pore complex protein n=1 Tax=Tribolium castaneum TaxID=7070 RepID=D6X0X5_TRICA|nr:PREDICTED: nuclear pore complex protein Nup107 [Tribolium castaneum]EFA09537.1 Nuclear pore complex protein Nup107-like Protein [Tribolium castaneum]|eukprot:XP_969501.1 PREDICTED: nuclear pore complex protein Nup107 [Tribolium castaneum]